MDAQAGCESCFGDDAAAVWKAHEALERSARVVDDSHFGLSLRRCSACGQRFAAVFCERIDWSGGNDPQDWLQIPIANDEADALVAAGADGGEAVLRRLAPDRRYLARWFDRDADKPEVGFVTGKILVPPHD